jgi:hypothetical protein
MRRDNSFSREAGVSPRAPAGRPLRSSSHRALRRPLA